MTTLDQIEITDTSAPAFVAAIPESRPSTMARSERIAIHLAALRSFFDIRNHSVDDSDPQTSSPDEWKHKIEIARAFTLRCIELIWVAGGQPDISAVEVVEGSLADLCDESSLGEPDHDAAVLYEIADSLSLLYDQLTIAGKAENETFAGFGSLAAGFLALNAKTSEANLSAPLGGSRVFRFLLGHQTKIPSKQRQCEKLIGSLENLLSILSIVFEDLVEDRPLKPVFPFLTLINQICRSVLVEIELLAELNETANRELFDVLDAVRFATMMELRKVFSFELVGLSRLTQPPEIYARVEDSHGLLRDSFQQSVVSILQLFVPGTTGEQLFPSYSTRLQQSLTLRIDLYRLLLLVRKAEDQRDRFPIAVLLEKLTSFKQTSMRFLMFKDWEACERFIEEIEASRGAIELAPVLNRFSAFLETLHGQVSMRAVLADHPFDPNQYLVA